MTTPSCILPADAEAKVLSEIELAIRAGVACALRVRAPFDGGRPLTALPSGDRFPGVVVRSPEESMAANLADAFERIAIEIEAGAPI